jgi:hypothetical protein
MNDSGNNPKKIKLSSFEDNLEDDDKKDIDIHYLYKEFENACFEEHVDLIGPLIDRIRASNDPEFRFVGKIWSCTVERVVNKPCSQQVLQILQSKGLVGTFAVTPVTNQLSKPSFGDACFYGDVERVKLLIKKEHDALNWNRGLLRACYGNKEKTKSANSWHSGLVHVDNKNYIEIIDLMIKNGATNFIELDFKMTKEMLNRGHFHIKNQYIPALIKIREKQQAKTEKWLKIVTSEYPWLIPLFEPCLISHLIVPYIAFE